MTVPNSDVGPWEYLGDNSTKTFAYLNKIFADTDLQVYLDDVLQTITTHYTVTNVGVATGGNVVFVTAPGVDVDVVIVRNVPDTQGLDLVENDDLPAADIENALDRRTIANQQLTELINRAIRQPGSEPRGNFVLPLIAGRASMFLAFDAQGNVVAAAGTSANLGPVSAFIDTLLDDADAATARATLEAAGTEVVNTFNASQILKSTDPGALEGPVLTLLRDSASPAAADVLGPIRFKGKDSNDNEITYVALLPEIVTPTDGAEDSRLRMRSLDGGTQRDMLYETGAILMPTAAGGLKAVGSVNASAVYDDGNQIHALQDGLETEIATTSGTAHDFTGIRSDAQRITITFKGVSLSGTNKILVQIGDSGGFEVIGYISTSTTAVAAASSTAGFVIYSAAGANTISGRMVLDLHDPATNTWISSHSVKISTADMATGGGDKALSGILTQVRITVDGADTFDAGAVNIKVE